MTPANVFIASRLLLGFFVFNGTYSHRIWSVVTTTQNEVRTEDDESNEEHCR